MRLSPREQDKLMIYVAAQLATDRKKRGLKLNYSRSGCLSHCRCIGGDSRWENRC